MATGPSEILHLAFQRATQNQHQSLVDKDDLREQIEFIARNPQNRACVRFIMACALAKVYSPEVDIRKPYTEIGDSDTYSGRTYDERYILDFVLKHELPCNMTTAFLTPAFRNRNITLTPDTNLVGRPPTIYKAALQLLDAVHNNRLSAEDLLAETLRWLVAIRDEKRDRMRSLLAALRTSKGETSLSAEGIVSLVEQHAKLRNTSRLPVLIVAAVYKAAQDFLGEQVLPLESHNAADKQTGSLGDLVITLIDDEQVITSYEMKAKQVTKDDIDIALDKIIHYGSHIHNYIFITTQPIAQEVTEYAISMYDKTGGIEIAILDCINFLRYFLHLFYRVRIEFLEAYQTLMLLEPESAVSQPLKEAFLAMRNAAESNAND
jgi:DNA adenine methylase